MSNNISDITVNIGVEDVINPATFGGICLYYPNADDTPVLPYTEVSSYSEAKDVIGKCAGVLDDGTGSVVKFNTLTAEATKTQLDALDTKGKIKFNGTKYTVGDESANIAGQSFSKRIEKISEDNGLSVTFENSDENLCLACCGSSVSKSVTLVLTDDENNIVDRMTLEGNKAQMITLRAGTSGTFTFYVTSEEKATLHLYGVTIAPLRTGFRNMLNMVETAFIQENPPEKLGLLSCAITSRNITVADYFNENWRYLIPTKEDISSDILPLSRVIESSKSKVLCLDISGTTAYKKFIADTYLKVKGMERTFVYLNIPVLKDDTAENLNNICVALMAHTGNKTVGSFTYKNMSLKGVYADESITKTTLNDYHSHNVNAYVHKAGYDVTSEGKMLNGEYIDILDAKDWLITQIKYQLQQCLIINDKIPYDNTGIAMLESVVANVLQEAFNNGIIAEDDNGKASYTVNFARRADTKASDREKRQYMEGKFTFDLAGAIHSVTVNGTINI